jgi:acetyl-CoA carboxylase carboxyl transferase subunit alpha
MHLNFLEFEQPIAELEGKIQELQTLSENSDISINDEIEKLRAKSRELTESIFSNLTTIQTVQIARHPLRPYTENYIDMIFTDFDELQGDRTTSAGAPIIAGLARFNGEPVMVMGHQKGRKTKEKLRRNFGMPKPEDYRKTLRLMKMAERFGLPIITLIDTSGAYPGIGAEERNQSEAIARNLFEMTTLKTPIICVVTGEGGSGGALALGVGDRVAMLQYSIYSVISPEGCASILWKSIDKAADAAQALKIKAKNIHKLGLIDEIIKEPLGGAHRDPETAAQNLKVFIDRELKALSALPMEALISQRYDRLMAYGVTDKS